MTKTVALLVGGWSAEREVSLMKGREVEQALKNAGYNVRRIDVTRDLSALIAALTPRPDAIFNNLHGRGGEDGTIQGVLEMLGIPYTHSGVLASAIGMDKPVCKHIAASVGVRVAKGAVFLPQEVTEKVPFPRPYVIKPAAEGSSVGVLIVRENDPHPKNLAENWPSSSPVLVEEYIPGRELTVAVLDGKAQGVTEIRPAEGFFDYHAKYDEDAHTQTLLPAPVPQEVYDLALDYAARIYNALGCEGLARCDFRFDDTKGPQGLVFLEINTQPGLTAASIGPSQVIRNGLSFEALCSHLVESARCKSVPEPAAPTSPAAAPARAAQG